jgi:RNA polymerase sigma factor (sigma-70 family)
VRTQASEDYDWWFRAAYTPVARTVFLIVHDRATAEDVVQDAFVQLYRHWSTVQGYERPDLWVRRVAIRMAVRRVKRDRMRTDRERLAVIDSREHADQSLPDPDLRRAVATLSPMQRAAVVLHYWADESVFDIARTLEVSESSVKQHLFRARSRLAILLDEGVTGDVG